MKTPYSADALARVLKRLYPNEKVQHDFGTVGLLRRMAFDDFTGRLIVSPFEYNMLKSASSDAINVGYLKTTPHEAVIEAWKDYDLHALLDNETHVHLSGMAKRLYDAMSEVMTLPSANGIYTAGLAPGGLCLFKSVTVPPIAADRMPPSAEFNVWFERASGRILNAEYSCGTDLGHPSVRVPSEIVDNINAWAEPRAPIARKAA